jgi:hypothetical protein
MGKTIMIGANIPVPIKETKPKNKGIIYVDFGSETIKCPFDVEDIKYIERFEDTKDDPILRYLYILRGQNHYVVKAPIEADPNCNMYTWCIVTRTLINS